MLQDNIFLLDPKSQLRIRNDLYTDKFERWQTVSHTIDKRLSFFLRYGEKLTTVNEVNIGTDTVAYLSFAAALPEISNDGLELHLDFIRQSQERPSRIATLYVTGGLQKDVWQTVTFNLSDYKGSAGCFQLSVGAGADGLSSADWVAISDFVISPIDELSFIRSHTHYAKRAENESDHFSSVYRNNFYFSGSKELESDDYFEFFEPVFKSKGSEQISLEGINPFEGEDALTFSSRCLQELLPNRPPNFTIRLLNKLKKQRKKKIKVLSLCSGSARVEADLAKLGGVQIDWTLCDINKDLLKLACKNFPSIPRAIQIDINGIMPFEGESFDIIICVSALHHIINLEGVFNFITKSLNDDGEFWSIGESIGRNGNKLWPKDYEYCNELFCSLPERYRRNNLSGKIDNYLPINDFSTMTFEGIRSQEIMPLLVKYLHPVELYQRNSFLWRLTNLAYMNNYDLSKLDDLEIIKKFVSHEVAWFSETRSATELHGIFRLYK